MLLLLIIIPLFALDCRAADQVLNFKRISVEQGLSQSTINCMLQDRTGFIWFATEDGLNRYDGNQFTIYRPVPDDPNSLSNHSIWALTQDSQGRIWVGTYNGLNRIDPKTDRITRFMPDRTNPHSLSHKHVLAIREDHTGMIWVGTNGGGLCRLDPQQQSFTVFRSKPAEADSLSDDHVLSLLEDRSGVLWIGTNNGLNRFDIHRQCFLPPVPSFTGDNVTAIHQDRDGIIWVGTNDGLKKIDPADGKTSGFRTDPDDPHSLSYNGVRCILEDHSGIIWVGTEQGLNAYDRRQGSFTRYFPDPDNPRSLPIPEARSLLEDDAGSLWVGTYGGGLAKFETQSKKFQCYFHVPNSSNTLSVNGVLSLYEQQDGILWIGTNGGGLNRFDRRANLFKSYRNDPRNPSSLSDDRVRAIFKDSTGAMWLGTYGGGLCKFDPGKGSFSCYQNTPGDPFSLSYGRVRSVAEDRSGALWAGTDGGGLNRFDPRTGRFKRYQYDPDKPGSLSNNRVMKIIIDHTGRMWIATFGGGLNCYQPETDSFKRYVNDPNNPASLSHDYVVTVFEDSHRVLWLGTDGTGLDRFDPAQGTFKHYTEAHGLPSKVVYAIQEDSRGCLWLSHNMGISRFDPAAETFKNYTEQDGLQGNEFTGNSSFKNPVSGEMFFGGISGFNCFFPESIQDNQRIPPVVITRFQIFNKPVAVGQRINGHVILPQSLQDTRKIVLSYLENVFAFEFTALNLISPEKNQYAFMMEGFEKNWNYVGNRRFAVYTALPPGNYVFRVKGSNNDGLWNERGASLQIEVTPPFWQTWGFRSLVGIVMLMTIFAVYRLRVRSILKTKTELEKLVGQRTQELKQAYAEMEQLSITDALTGLYNRRYFINRVQQDIELIIRQNHRRSSEKIVFAAGFLMIDLDFFKQVNDSLGHDAGDALLQAMAQRFTATVRASDILVRWGGEEFLMMSIENDFEGAKLLSERLLQVIGGEPYQLSDQTRRITISIGYCSFPLIPKNPRLFNWEETVKMADHALFVAKKSGRNCAVGVRLNADILNEETIALLKADFQKAAERNIYSLVLSPGPSVT